MTEMRRFSSLLAAVLGIAGAPLSAQTSGEWGDELPGMIEAPEGLLQLVPPMADRLDWPAAPVMSPPREIKAIYLNAWVFGTRRFYDLVRLVQGTEINAFVVDVKDDTGYLTYTSQVPTAIQIGANQARRAPDTRARLAYLRAHGIYPIARIVVAKDPLLAEKKPQWSVRNQRGGLWRDRLNFAWVDAYNDSIWVYAAQLGEEAVRQGFEELQFDYVRFPDEPRARLAGAVFPARHGRESSRAAIVRNLRLLRDRVRNLGVPFTVDVFGLTTSAEGDLGIGQVWEDLVTTADVVLPMVYPSHYYHGYYNISHPNSEPYRTIRRAMEDALRRSAPLDASAQIRPYLQAFTLGPPRYTPAMVREQIRAVEELGLTSWVLWNPRGVYSAGMFRQVSPEVGLVSPPVSPDSASADGT